MPRLRLHDRFIFGGEVYEITPNTIIKYSTSDTELVIIYIYEIYLDDENGLRMRYILDNGTFNIGLDTSVPEWCGGFQCYNPDIDMFMYLQNPQRDQIANFLQCVNRPDFTFHLAALR